METSKIDDFDFVLGEGDKSFKDIISK